MEASQPLLSRKSGAQMNSKPFKGTNVFMSRNLVPPEIFASLKDALELNGADVSQCCDPSRNSSNDYHVIASSDHEKFKHLQGKGCKLVGPQCVLACAKERRAFPKQLFTCCLAMDGVKVLTSGFDKEEKDKIKELVSAMGGSFLNEPSSDVSFVIVKNVIAAKYKWALKFKKSVVTIDWLYQCWNEHRIVSQESYRVPTFFGLMICVTRIPADKRREMEKLIVQNGGRYSAELTRACTHLICDTPEGDKYKVAKRWGHVRIVTRKWFDQSIVKRACLAEESYPVQGISVPSDTMMKGHFTARSGQDRSTGTSQPIPFSAASNFNLQAVQPSWNVDLELGKTLSQCHSFKDEEVSMPEARQNTNVELEDCVAKDSEDDGLYLSDCKFCLVGFNASETRKLVGLIRKGGGSRYVSYSERLTHIVVGSPSDAEKKELRALAALGVICVVHPTWLEDCDRAKKEIPAMQRHMAHDLLGSSQGFTTGKGGMKQEKVSTVLSMRTNLSSEVIRSEQPMVQEEREKAENVNINSGMVPGKNSESSYQFVSTLTDNGKSRKVQQTSSLKTIPRDKPSGVFAGRLFCFSSSFPQDRRDEVVEWIIQGGGKVADNHLKQKVDFTVECHGVFPQPSSLLQAVHVSSHWVRSCLEDGVLLDVGSHMLYSPLPCPIPLKGFENHRFCVSQYEGKDRLLLRNLCFVLGAKFVEKLTRKVTHLLCKFSTGVKYEKSLKWGIKPVTCEWIYECVRKGEEVALDSFHPKVLSDRDREAGLCTVSQYPTQADKVLSGNNSSQFYTQSLEVTRPVILNANMEASGSKKEADFASDPCKKQQFSETFCPAEAHNLCLGSDQISPPCVSSRGGSMQQYAKENSQVPDVAAVIEDLLEQTTKIRDPAIPGGAEGDKSVFPSDHPVLCTDPADSHTAFGLSKNWLRSVVKQDEPHNPAGDGKTGVHDSFSETQTESQLVGYEEDLSGRQMIIERVRSTG